MMRNALPDLRRRLCASDVESAVDLDRIEIYDLAACRFGEAKSELRFSDASRAGDDDDHMRSLMSAGHVRALVFTSENAAQVLAAVDRAGGNRRSADLAAVLHYHLRRSLFREPRDDAGNDHQAADDQRFLQHPRREVRLEVGARGGFV